MQFLVDSYNNIPPGTSNLYFLCNGSYREDYAFVRDKPRGKVIFLFQDDPELQETSSRLVRFIAKQGFAAIAYNPNTFEAQQVQNMSNSTCAVPHEIIYHALFHLKDCPDVPKEAKARNVPCCEKGTLSDCNSALHLLWYIKNDPDLFKISPEDAQLLDELSEEFFSTPSQEDTGTGESHSAELFHGTGTHSSSGPEEFDSPDPTIGSPPPTSSFFPRVSNFF